MFAAKENLQSLNGVQGILKSFKPFKQPKGMVEYCKINRVLRKGNKSSWLETWLRCRQDVNRNIKTRKRFVWGRNVIWIVWEEVGWGYLKLYNNYYFSGCTSNGLMDSVPVKQ